MLQGAPEVPKWSPRCQNGGTKPPKWQLRGAKKAIGRGRGLQYIIGTLSFLVLSRNNYQPESPRPNLQVSGDGRRLQPPKFWKGQGEVCEPNGLAKLGKQKQKNNKIRAGNALNWSGRIPKIDIPEEHDLIFWDFRLVFGTGNLSKPSVGCRRYLAGPFFLKKHHHPRFFWGF